MVDDVRRRVQQETTGHRGRDIDPLYRIRQTLLMAADRLTDRQWTRLEAARNAADPNAEVYNAWAVKSSSATSTPPTTSTPPARRSRRSTTGPPASASAKPPGSPGPSADGKQKSWRSTSPAAPPTAPRSGRPAHQEGPEDGPRVAPVLTTTDCGCCCTAAWTGTMPPLHESEDDDHAQRRRVRNTSGPPRRDDYGDIRGDNQEPALASAIF
jgi:hypothetical protein